MLRFQKRSLFDYGVKYVVPSAASEDAVHEEALDEFGLQEGGSTRIAGKGTTRPTPLGYH